MSDSSDAAIIAGVSDSDRLLIETLYGAFSAGQVDLLDDAVTPNWQDIPLAPGQAPGREGMKVLINGFLAAFPDAKITVREMIGAGGRVAVRAEITGTHRGEWFGIPASGKAFVLPIHEFHIIENGRLTQTRHMEDWLGWMFQVGAWPPGAN